MFPRDSNRKQCKVTQVTFLETLAFGILSTLSDRNVLNEFNRIKNTLHSWRT